MIVACVVLAGVLAGVGAGLLLHHGYKHMDDPPYALAKSEGCPAYAGRRERRPPTRPRAQRLRVGEGGAVGWCRDNRRWARREERKSLSSAPACVREMGVRSVCTCALRMRAGRWATGRGASGGSAGPAAARKL